MAVADGVIYVGAQDAHVYAVDADTGAEVWRYRTDSNVVTTPAILDDLVYVASFDNNVYALDIDTGVLRWKYETGDSVWSSPAVADGTVFVGSNDDHLYALDALTGELRWKYETGESIPGSPTVVDGKVYFNSYDDHVYALDAASGELHWRFEIGQGALSKPLVAEGLVFIGSWDERLYALDQETGALRWNYWTGDSMLSSPAVQDGLVFFGSDDGLVYALESQTGDLRWSHQTGDQVRSSPTVAGGIVYVGSFDDHVYALDASTGTLLWRYETDGDLRASPLSVDGVLYIGSRDGYVYALSAGAGERSVVVPEATPTPDPASAFVPLTEAEIKPLLDFALSTDEITITEITDHTQLVLDIFRTGYYLLVGRTPEEDGWVPRIMTGDAYLQFIDDNHRGDPVLKRAVAFCCDRTSDGLDLIINGSWPVATVLASLPHEVGHARQKFMNPVQSGDPRDSDVGAIREGEAYAFEAALLRKLGEYARVNATQVPVDSTASRFFDSWRVLWLEQFDDLTLEHERGALLLWLAALNDSRLEGLRDELLSEYILSPASLLAIHNLFVELAPGEIGDYVAELRSHYRDDFNVIGGTLERRKGNVPLEGFVEHAPLIFVIP